VFGVPGTVTGDIWSRTELTGDWGVECEQTGRAAAFSQHLFDELLLKRNVRRIKNR
jgi:hypothetical protein